MENRYLEKKTDIWNDNGSCKNPFILQTSTFFYWKARCTAALPNFRNIKF